MAGSLYIRFPGSANDACNNVLLRLPIYTPRGVSTKYLLNILNDLNNIPGFYYLAYFSFKNTLQCEKLKSEYKHY